MQLNFGDLPIWLASQPVDFRKSIDGLGALVQAHMPASVQQGIFIFYNRSRDRLKVLVWHGNGFLLLYKRLEKGHFTVKFQEQPVSLTAQQCHWLLAGLDWITASQFESLPVTNFC